MSERSRERIVHRYYQGWLDSSIGYRNASETDAHSRLHLDGSALRPSNDRSLIAFAQLGCLRLNAKRGIVTLISSTRQYILAEALKTTSLLHAHVDHHDKGDELWFGNASLPRSQGISADALNPLTYTATGPDGDQHSAAALVVNDIAVDSRYCDRGYAGNGVNFYCGVPIVTSSGFPIGVYTITDDKPRNGLSPAELRFMEDVAVVIMDHLDTVQNDAARFRGEKLVLGLGCFVQGQSSLSANQHSSSVSEPPNSKSPLPPAAVETDGDHVLRFKGMTITDANPRALRPREDPNRPQMKESVSDVANKGSVGVEGDSNQDRPTFVLENKDPVEVARVSQPLEIAQIFSRAANILRECATADGVVFYDAVSNNFAKGPATAHPTRTEQIRTAESASSDDTTSPDHAFDSSDRESAGSPASSDGSRTSRVLSSRGKACSMLGYSFDVSSGSTANVNSINALTLSESSLRRLIRRYPQGKMFFFSDVGNFSSDSEQSSEVPASVEPAKQSLNRRPKLNKTKSATSSASIAAELIQIVPGARSVMWLPLWDFAKQRWSAGCFLWSRHPDRLLNAQADLTYLRTFASCIMGELSRLEAVIADTARTTFIANISHELRSPLHGILGSIEFLQDTALDDFQSSMTSSIETCGRTLLDTVEHVLDYAKINDLLKKHPKIKGSSSPSRLQGRKQERAFERDFSLADIVEDVVEAVYSGHIFHSAGKIKDSFDYGHEDDARSPSTIQEDVRNANAKFSDAVNVVIAIQRLDNWWVRGQPGAIRRIVMNLFGNSLKYTNEGSIKISLTSSLRTTQSSKHFCITIADTGIGMNPEFLQNHAFTAFTQESRFSVGAGLGLNIVRQIVNALRGKVEVSSQRGVGTEVKVWLTLPEAPNPLATGLERLVDSVAKETMGRTVCLLNPTGNNKEEKKRALKSAILDETELKNALTSWFGMRVLTATSMDDISAGFYLYAEPPPITHLLEQFHVTRTRRTEIPVVIIASNAFESAALLTNGIQRLTDLGHVIEVTSQPCGPQKLARVFRRAIMRTADLARDSQNRNVNSSAKRKVVDDVRSTGLALGESVTAATTRGEAARPSYSRSTTEHPKALGTEDQGFNADQDEPGLNFSRRYSPSSPSSPFDFAPSAANVLLVDDNPINLKLLVAFMRKANLPHETATNGADAVQAYKRAAFYRRFDHVLMDVSMPVMDGVAATREIRQFEKRENLTPVSIIALTGQASESTRTEMFDAGADEFKTKPVKFRELMEMVEKAG